MDRNLTHDEITKFRTEGTDETPKLFSALETIHNENTQPTLHDLCILELNAKVDGQRKIIINQGKRIAELEKQLNEKKGEPAN